MKDQTMQLVSVPLCDRGHVPLIWDDAHFDDSLQMCLKICLFR